MKAISAIIVVVLLLLISISLISVVYVWSSALTGTVTSTTEETTSELTKQLSSCLKIDAISGNKIYLRNCGKGVITNKSLNIFLDNEKIKANLDKTIAEEQQGVLRTGKPLVIKSMDLRTGDNLKISNGATQIQYTLGAHALKKALFGDDFSYYKSWDDASIVWNKYGSDIPSVGAGLSLPKSTLVYINTTPFLYGTVEYKAMVNESGCCCPWHSVTLSTGGNGDVDTPTNTYITMYTQGNSANLITCNNGVCTNSYGVAHVSENVYHIYKIVWSPGKVEFYLDNNLIKTHTTNIMSSQANFVRFVTSNPWCLGCDPCTRPYNIEWVKIY